MGIIFVTNMQEISQTPVHFSRVATFLSTIDVTHAVHKSNDYTDYYYKKGNVRGQLFLQRQRETYEVNYKSY